MVKDAEILSIGTELTSGQTLNTNAQFLSESLANLGISTKRHITIPDKKEIITPSIKELLGRTSILIITGGLGPTIDDLTLECISKALSKKLIFNNNIADLIRGYFKKQKLKMPRENLKQAFVPEGAKVLLNPIGTAPGLIISYKKSFVIALPGVPAELKSIFQNSLKPFFKKNFPNLNTILTRTIKVTALSESEVNRRIKNLLPRFEKKFPGLGLGIYPHPEEILLRITAKAKTQRLANRMIKDLETKIRERLGDYIFGVDRETIEENLGRLFSKDKKTLAIAESCTGGLISNRITDIPSSSMYFKMAVITYSNESKINLLGIPIEIIKKYGAVSKEVASLMAKNIRLLAKVDFGLGITGICGPLGATPKKPVGLIFIAISSRDKRICKDFRFLGERRIIKLKASQAALDMLRKFVEKSGE